MRGVGRSELLSSTKNISMIARPRDSAMHSWQTASKTRTVHKHPTQDGTAIIQDAQLVELPASPVGVALGSKVTIANTSASHNRS